MGWMNTGKEVALQLARGIGKEKLGVAAKNSLPIVNLMGGGKFTQAMGEKAMNTLFQLLNNMKSTVDYVIKVGGKTKLNKDAVRLLGEVVKNVTTPRMAEVVAEILKQQALQKKLMQQASKLLLKYKLGKTVVAGTLSPYVGSRMVSQFQAFPNQVNQDQMKNGMADNLAANIHQLGLVGFGMTTPDNKLIYHT